MSSAQNPLFNFMHGFVLAYYTDLHRNSLHLWSTSESSDVHSVKEGLISLQICELFHAYGISIYH
jgi:hypothetical protein